jgi:hypothetical protein
MRLTYKRIYVWQDKMGEEYVDQLEDYAGVF